MLVSQKLVDRVNGLIMLEHDGARAFERALMCIIEPSLQSGLGAWLAEHRTHVLALARLVRSYGGQVVERRDVAKFLSEGFMAPDDARGDDVRVLRAMRHNEAFVCGVYDEVLRARDLPEDIRRLVTGLREDERRHIEWFDRVLGRDKRTEEPAARF